MFPQTPSGIGAIGPLAWGSHFCHFYQGGEDLADILVPYIRAGIEAHEKCVWMASEPLDVQAAEGVLRSGLADFDRRRAQGQITIRDAHQGYSEAGRVRPEAILAYWQRGEAQALEAGYGGLRVAGNTYWLPQFEWDDFQDYEAMVSEYLRGRRIVALCSYCTGRCDAAGVLDVVRAHHFAVARRRGDWQVLEDASLKLARAELERLNCELEARVTERTQHLVRALADRDILFREVHHRVRNNLQVVTSLLLNAQRRLTHQEARSALQETINRVHVIALVHEVLYADADAMVDLSTYLSRLGAHLGRVHGSLGRIDLQVDAAAIRIGLDQAVPLGLIVNEVLWNALKHAFPDGRCGHVLVHLTAESDAVDLHVTDDGIGLEGPPPPAAGAGLGIVRRLVDQLGGNMAIGPHSPRGTAFRLRFAPRVRETVCQP